MVSHHKHSASKETAPPCILTSSESKNYRRVQMHILVYTYIYTHIYTQTHSSMIYYSHQRPISESILSHGTVKRYDLRILQRANQRLDKFGLLVSNCLINSFKRIKYFSYSIYEYIFVQSHCNLQLPRIYFYYLKSRDTSNSTLIFSN